MVDEKFNGVNLKLTAEGKDFREETDRKRTHDLKNYKHEKKGFHFIFLAWESAKVVFL